MSIDESSSGVFSEARQWEGFEHFASAVDDIVNDCLHPSRYEENGVEICPDCGLQVDTISYEPEWRTTDSNKKDSSRCHGYFRRTQGTVASQLMGMGFAPDVSEKVQNRYQDVAKISSASSPKKDRRMGVIGACMFHVYYEMDLARSVPEIAGMLHVEVKEINLGLKTYSQAFPEHRSRAIRPRDLIRGSMVKIGLDDRWYYDVRAIAEMLENESKMLNRSTPQSTAAAILYLYLCLHPKLRREIGVTRHNFSDKIGLSDVTIQKLVEEAKRLIETL